MSFGYAKSVRAARIFDCTDARHFSKVLTMPIVGETCAELRDLLEQRQSGGITADEYDQRKAELKKRLPVFTFQATYGGRARRNENAVPTGLAIYDKDHVPSPEEYWRERRATLAAKNLLRGCVALAHVTPSGEGLRIVFRIPAQLGTDIAAAQRWMASVLGDTEFDSACKDLARCSFAVPTDYVLYEDDALLFGKASTAGSNAGLDGRPQGPHPAEDTTATADGNDGLDGRPPCGTHPAEGDNVQAATPPAAGASLVGARTPERRTEAADTKIRNEGMSGLGNPDGQGGAAGVGRDVMNYAPTGNAFSNPPILDNQKADGANSQNSPILDNQKADGANSPNSPILDNQKGAGADSPNSPILDNQKAGGADSPNSPFLDKKEDMGTFPQDYDGTPYGLIVSRLVEQLGGVPAHGSRNTFIFTLACHLRYLCDDNAAWIKSIIPTFGELRQKADATVESACNRQQQRPMPAVVKRAIMLAKRDHEAQSADDGGQAGPPPMPRKLPPLIKLLLRCTPDIYKPAVAHAVFPALATHLWHTQFRYIDNKLHEATLMNVLMAGTGAGKDCITDPIDHIMADIRERDEKNMRREREWKDEVNSKGANKDKRKRPEGLVIQEVDPDMTNPAFVMRTAEAEDHFLYTKMNEIDQFDALRGSGRGGQQFKIMCLAFDPNNRYGQTRVGTQSITERVTVRFNWNATTTIRKGQQYFAGVLTDGPISRINFCTIPERELCAAIPVYGTYTPEFDDELRPYIQNLTEARGIVEIPQAGRLARKLLDELADFTAVSGSRTFENLSYRANVIAWLKGCVLYVAQGGKWDKTIEEFVRWSLRYDMWCKMRFFGNDIDEVERAAMKTSKRGPKNLLQQLPDTFTLEDLISCRKANGMFGDGARNMVSVWKRRKYVIEMTDNDSFSFRKLKFRHDGIDIAKNRA